MSQCERVYIGLGANLGHARQTLNQAVKDIAAIEGVSLIAVSSLYCSRPLDGREGPDYHNAVVAIDSTLSLPGLLAQLQTIETRHGRIRSEDRWMSRTLDLDILLAGEQCIRTSALTVPHYDMHNRDFVLLPLAEIAPGLNLPGLGKVEERVQQLNSSLEPITDWRANANIN